MSLHASRELWQGRASVPCKLNNYFGERNFPQDFVSVLHVEHGIVLGKIVKFFTQVWISRTGGDGIYDVIVFCSLGV